MSKIVEGKATGGTIRVKAYDEWEVWIPFRGVWEPNSAHKTKKQAARAAAKEEVSAIVHITLPAIPACRVGRPAGKE